MPGRGGSPRVFAGWSSPDRSLDGRSSARAAWILSLAKPCTLDVALDSDGRVDYFPFTLHALACPLGRTSLWNQCGFVGCVVMTSKIPGRIRRCDSVCAGQSTSILQSCGPVIEAPCGGRLEAAVAGYAESRGTDSDAMRYRRPACPGYRPYSDEPVTACAPGELMIGGK